MHGLDFMVLSSPALPKKLSQTQFVTVKRRVSLFASQASAFKVLTKKVWTSPKYVIIWHIFLPTVSETQGYQFTNLSFPELSCTLPAQLLRNSLSLVPRAPHLVQTHPILVLQRLWEVSTAHPAPILLHTEPASELTMGTAPQPVQCWAFPRPKNLQLHWEANSST